MTFFILFAFSVALSLLAKTIKHRTISWKEIICQIVILAVVAGIASGLAYHRQISDTEIWNGKVQSKNRETVHCSHSYDCHCRESCTGSGKDKTCRRVCDTCYDHSEDYDWVVATSNGEKIEIDREDRQGRKIPDRFARVQIGEPTAREHKYKNYLLAAPESVLHSRVSEEMMTRYKDFVPEHPKVFDYYRSKQFLPLQISEVDSQVWNQKLAEINATLGARKQVNIIVIMTSLPPDFFHVLRAEWKGGKKNDVIVVIGIEKDFSILWVETMAWSVDGGFGARMRQAVAELTSAKEADIVLSVISSVVEKDFHRKPMKEFKYLLDAIELSSFDWIICILVMLCAFGILTWYFDQHEVFEDKLSYYRFGRNRKYF